MNISTSLRAASAALYAHPGNFAPARELTGQAAALIRAQLTSEPKLNQVFETVVNANSAMYRPLLDATRSARLLDLAAAMSDAVVAHDDAAFTGAYAAARPLFVFDPAGGTCHD